MRRRCQAALLTMILCLGGTSAQAYDLTITGGTVHGPGPHARYAASHGEARLDRPK